jgi:hypothetical protein
MPDVIYIRYCHYSESSVLSDGKLRMRYEYGMEEVDPPLDAAPAAAENPES